MTDTFVFKSNQSIGAAAAEQDQQYLRECFVNTGVLAILRDCNDHRCILVGRTGSGKSALISRLHEEEAHAISVQPENLSLAYISNSSIINFFLEIGVNLNLFFRLLWRHVFCVEILKEKFDINSEKRKQNFLSDVWNFIKRNKKHEMALKYLEDWGDSFWLETDHRIKEVTNKLERDLTGAVEETIPGFKLDFSAARKLSQEQKEEVIYRAQQVVNKVQLKELSAIMDFLDEILSENKQKRYYITIDKLDEDWVEDRLRFRLIRALIETSIDFTGKVSNAKVIVVLRSDLLDRVYRFTRDPGFQEEKHRTSTIDLIWQGTQLTEVLDSRIDKLVKTQYTKQKVTHRDILRPILVARGKSRLAIDYMLERTLLRPRDVIQFFNACIKQASDKPVIENHHLREAEGDYSRERFRALVDEWYGVYPNLGLTAQILKKRNNNFRVKELLTAEVADLCLNISVSNEAVEGSDLDLIRKVSDGDISAQEYKRQLVLMLYKVSLLGIRTNDNMPISWSHLSASSVSGAEVDDESRAYIHPMFWRHFGISDTTDKI